MEQQCQIRVPGIDKQIYGIVHGDEDRPGVVLAHGVAGSVKDVLMVNGARFLHAAGFAVLRFNFYGGEADARKMHECTIPTHVEDLSRALEWMAERQGGRPVSVIGHSLGGMLTLCLESPKLSSAVLWDPTHPSRGDFTKRSDVEWREDRKEWCWDWGGTSLLLTEQYVESWRKTSAEAGASRLAAPLLVISASEGPRAEAGRRYIDLANQDKRFVGIPHADHWFVENGAFAELQKETLAWLDLYGR